MTTRRFGFIAIVAVVAGLSIAAVGAQSDKKKEGIAGTWKLSVDSAHGAMSMGLTLMQDGRKVTGTFASPHGDLSVEGEFADGALKLATTSTDPDALHVTFTGKLTDKGGLAGYLSSQMGDMKWTAERLKDE